MNLHDIDRQSRQMILYRKFGVAIGESYFRASQGERGVDLVRYLYADQPFPGMPCTSTETIHIDLNLDSHELLRSFKKPTRYDVRRASEDDGFVCRFPDGSLAEVREKFYSFYAQFADSKNIRPVNKTRIDAIGRSGQLMMSTVEHPDGSVLAWHAHIWDSARALLLHAPSLHRYQTDAAGRQAAARANRFLHWNDMLHFQQRGVSVLDLGGWYAGQDDSWLCSVSNFKAGFGGSVAKTYNCVYGLSRKGKFAVSLWNRRTIPMLYSHFALGQVRKYVLRQSLSTE